IMQDSRIGAFGTAALVLALYLRVESLALIAAGSLKLAAAVLIAGATVSRMAALVPLAALPPARQNGAGFAAGRPAIGPLAIAACLAIFLALLPVAAGASLLQTLAGIALSGALACTVTMLAKHQIGGQTGDVAGAAQQLGEIGFYLAFAARF
ncbi:MAG: adenosylcobinamide-GDP ribazoletransferase, partial [Beijerinckiaceae bacterium]|nr:adenosylcobinamide-GDP ribazoletransferase [Beijerinckiaceae bacterium]